MLAEIAVEQLSAALDETVNELLSWAEVTQPPVDAHRVAARLGIDVGVNQHQSERARFVRRGGMQGGNTRELIVLSPEPRGERRQWAVAHEIGESWAHRVFAALGVDPREAPDAARERVANQLAGRLLLPACWFERDAVGCSWDLLQLKSRFRTASHELIARRMLDFAPTILITIFDKGRISMRRASHTTGVTKLSPLESDCQRHVHQTAQPDCREHVGRCRVDGWPIHEPAWKREILRTEIFGFDDF